MEFVVEDYFVGRREYNFLVVGLLVIVCWFFLEELRFEKFLKVFEDLKNVFWRLVFVICYYIWELGELVM